jgi:hypothetical protein
MNLKSSKNKQHGIHIWHWFSCIWGRVSVSREKGKPVMLADDTDLSQGYTTNRSSGNIGWSKIGIGCAYTVEYLRRIRTYLQIMPRMRGKGSPGHGWQNSFIQSGNLLKRARLVVRGFYGGSHQNNLSRIVTSFPVSWFESKFEFNVLTESVTGQARFPDQKNGWLDPRMDAARLPCLFTL